MAELERQRAEIVAATEGANADDEHDPEGATIAFEREQISALLEGARRARQEAVQALRRWDEGTYGTCVRCGEPVGAERLAARPTAQHCITCAG